MENPLLLRHNQERQRSQAINLTLQLILFTTLVIAAVTLSYMAWSENDPYQQIEEDVSKLTEETKPLEN
jgi:regulatory protein YycH of two-component signal transduction system YycFG